MNSSQFKLLGFPRKIGLPPLFREVACLEVRRSLGIRIPFACTIEYGKSFVEFLSHE